MSRITQTLDAFNSVELNDYFDVYLKEDSVYSIEIDGYDKSIQEVIFEVEDSLLKLSNESNSRWLQPNRNEISVIIKCPSFKEIRANETCHIKTKAPLKGDEVGLVLGSKANQATLELDCKTFYYWNSFPCGGQVTLSGQVENLKIWNTAIMSVNAQELRTEYALVDNSSKGKCTVHVTNKLEYQIDGLGDIEVYGGPSTIIKNGIEGEGKLLLMD